MSALPSRLQAREKFMRKFRMQCPKCGSHNLDLERDYRGSAARGPHQVQLHCFTCGKVLYGEKAVQEEYEKQFAEWESTQRSLPAERPRPSASLAPLVRPVVAKVVSGDGDKQGSNVPAPVPPVADGATPEWWSWPHQDITVDHSPQPPGWEKCAWDTCKRGRRPRSKYCSRNCSNKNARSRHARRKKD